MNMLIKNQINELLKSGKTYKEIGDELHVSKSTICYWFSKLNFQEKNKIKNFRANNWKKSIKFYQTSLRKRTLILETNIQKKYSLLIKNINLNELLLVGTALYWAEGTKRNRWQLQFSNSDPAMIKIMIKYFEDICHVSKTSLYMQLILSKNIDSQVAIDYWSKVTKVPKANFKKPCYSKSISSKSIRDKNSLPFGTLQIRILNKEITHMVYGYVQGLGKIVK